ncbi:MAG TPA: WYL domain-containing protein, partial [Actinomycetota bacterium]|nr:WYL domain-containing protein [Actinomycetota bacterium]
RPETERTVHPLGLVAKASVWYLVAGTDAGMRTFRVNRVQSVVVTQDRVERPDGFDLEAHWRSVIADLDERRLSFRATAVADAEAIHGLRAVFGTRLSVGAPEPDGRVRVEIRSWSAPNLAGELAGFGRSVEILDPPEVGRELARIGDELRERYAGRTTGATRPRARSPSGRPRPRPNP